MGGPIVFGHIRGGKLDEYRIHGGITGGGGGGGGGGDATNL